MITFLILFLSLSLGLHYPSAGTGSNFGPLTGGNADESSSNWRRPGGGPGAVASFASVI